MQCVLVANPYFFSSIFVSIIILSRIFHVLWFPFGKLLSPLLGHFTTLIIPWSTMYFFPQYDDFYLFFLTLGLFDYFFAMIFSFSQGIGWEYWTGQFPFFCIVLCCACAERSEFRRHIHYITFIYSTTGECFLVPFAINDTLYLVVKSGIKMRVDAILH